MARPTIDMTGRQINSWSVLERLSNSKGYVPGNVQWVHKKINMMKHTMTQEELIRWSLAIANTVIAQDPDRDPRISVS